MKSNHLLVFMVCFFFLALTANTIQLQPVAADLKTVRPSDILELRFCFQAVKIDTSTADCAGQKVLMAGCPAENSLALVEIMDAVNQVQGFQFFDGAVYGDQPNGGHIRACYIKNLNWCEGMIAGGNNPQDRPPGFSQAAARLLQFMFPFL